MVEAITKRKWFFKIPKFAWLLLVLWWLLHVVIVLKVGVNAAVLGRLAVDLLFPLLVPYVITYPVWLFTKRSQKTAAVVFSLLVLFIVFSQLSYRATHRPEAANGLAGQQNPRAATPAGKPGSQ